MENKDLLDLLDQAEEDPSIRMSTTTSMLNDRDLDLQHVNLRKEKRVKGASNILIMQANKRDSTPTMKRANKPPIAGRDRSVSPGKLKSLKTKGPYQLEEKKLRGLADGSAPYSKVN